MANLSFYNMKTLTIIQKRLRYIKKFILDSVHCDIREKIHQKCSKGYYFCIIKFARKIPETRIETLYVGIIAIFILVYWIVKRSDILHHVIAEVINIEKKSFLKVLGFGREVAKVDICRCPLCSEIVDKGEFRNKAFIKEFESSGLCQGCQDTVFGYRIAW